ncbi:DUF2075 domain-containing protein [Spirosoma pollinicola]|uniref:AAA family ATPase n=1 Tax=Spirosoma pollinicola TaxID=2057025 RepID=A0A2K8Z7Z8_9BACT|nr:DUF2075 domain-containing protein [Spirosoma pollinicola]AUD05949.1 AAA family ATPase [Spirosoma pollinicola]
MIVYQASKGQFLDDVLSNEIENIILKSFKDKLHRTTSSNEIRSWKESLAYMDRILQDPAIPEDCGVAVEYQVPQTSKRMDFILSGYGVAGEEYAILIELKQWEKASLTSKDGVVETYVGGGVREVAHPSYQAWSYAALLQGFNEAVYTGDIQLKPCAYLHNYQPDSVLSHEFYQEYIRKAPIFLRSDAVKLREFIKTYVKRGDQSKVIYKIDGGEIRPSKALADSMVSLLKGNKEFVMIDDQKIVYETALSLAKQSSSVNKNVLIVQGGPGTGKSVVAVNLLVELTTLGLLAQYVSKNAAPRAVYESKLTGAFRKTLISNMFKGSGGFYSTAENEMDALIVDEAHRLNEKSGLYSNLGENQIKEIINTAKCAIFFLDENQRVTLNDIGEIDEIRRWANLAGATIHEMELSSQFRCGGSDGYLSWLDNILQIHETANYDLNETSYDFRVIDSPASLRDLIFEKNEINNKSRLVAGYCWPWESKKNPQADDIVFPQYDFSMKWNLTTDGSLWILGTESVNEVGCIHTCQGLEVDYIGVIIGPDLVVRNGEVITDPSKRAKSDSSTRTYKSYLKKNRESGPDFIDKIIKNTYRTLMTRGMKGCYIYSADPETREYFSENL